MGPIYTTNIKYVNIIYYRKQIMHETAVYHKFAFVFRGTCPYIVFYLQFIQIFVSHNNVR